MDQRDFIIGSLHGLDPDVLAEMTPSVAFDMPHRLEALEARASELATGISVGGIVLYDIERIFQRVRELSVSVVASPAWTGILLDRVLTALPREPAADLALRFVGSLGEPHLPRLSRAGLLALRDAACLAPADESAAAVAALDDELDRRGPLAWQEVSGTWILSEGTDEGTPEAARERVERMHAHSRLSTALEGLTIVVVPRAECCADRAVLVAHTRACARRELDPRVGHALGAFSQQGVTFLDEDRVISEARRLKPLVRHAYAARSLLKGLASRLRPDPAPIAAQ